MKKTEKMSILCKDGEAKKRNEGDKKEKKKERRRLREKKEQKEGCNTRTSQGVTHPSTTLAQARLTAEF